MTVKESPAFKVTVEGTQSDDNGDKPGVVELEAFSSKKKAEAFKRKMMGKYGLKRHAGHIVNYVDCFELFTNY